MKTDIGISWQNIKAFDDALLESDSGVYLLVTELVERLANKFQTCGNITSIETARNQAKQVIARIVDMGKFDRLFVDAAK